MSQNSYDPNSPQQPAHDGGFSPDHEPRAEEMPPTRKSRKWLWIVVGVFGLGTLGLVICCGVGSLYFSEISSSLLEPARTELNQLTEIQTEIGNIEGLSMNFGGTLKEAEIHPDFVILDAQTESGPSQISVKMNPDGSIEEAYLIRKDGTRKELDLGSRIAAAEFAPSMNPQSPTASENQSANEAPPALDAPAPDAPVLDATELELRELESELELN